MKEVFPIITNAGEPVDFKGHGVCTENYDIERYEWMVLYGSNETQKIGYNPEFDIYEFPAGAGEYYVFFRVQCGQGEWSDYVVLETPVVIEP
ncbi:MAG: hypothetical protein ACOC7U_02800 [Spirochaetota bacterium]